MPAALRAITGNGVNVLAVGAFYVAPLMGCDLDKSRLSAQLKEMKEMGFGGVRIHPREGLRVPYLKEQYMDAVGFCVEQAKKLGLTVWLYDDERWPSGNAGGYVTQNPDFRKKYIRITQKEIKDAQLLEQYRVTHAVSISQSSLRLVYGQLCQKVRGLVRRKPSSADRPFFA